VTAIEFYHRGSGGFLGSTTFRFFEARIFMLLVTTTVLGGSGSPTNGLSTISFSAVSMNGIYC